MILIVAGIILGVAVLATVNQSSLFSISCYHFGALKPDTFCFNPNVYYGVLGLAGAMVILGLALLIRKNCTAARP